MNTVETLTSPFKHLVMTIGELPTTFIESMSYYEALAWLVNYLEKTVIPTVNNNAAVTEETQKLFIELKEYVDNYFDNLDVQDEIDNKLDEMAEQGELADIIAAYLQLRAILAYDTVASMKSATNLIDGSYAHTLGFTTAGDGGNATYKVRTITESDTPNESTLIAIGDSLVAEYIPEDIITPMKFGAAGDGTTDDTDLVQEAIDYVEALGLPLTIDRTYAVTSLSLTNGTLNGDGTLKAIGTGADYNLVVLDGTGKIDGIHFICNAETTGVRVANVNAGGSATIENCHFTGEAVEYIAVLRPFTIIKNNYIDGSTFHCTHAIRFGTGSDNSFMSGNELKDVSGFNIQTYNTNHITIENNKILNPYYEMTKSPSGSTLTITFTSTEKYLKRFGVYKDGNLDTTATVVNNEDGTYTVTFSNAITAGNTIKLVGWKSLENININGGCTYINVLNNIFNTTGDSNIVVGNDYTGTLANPSYIKIDGNTLYNAHDAGIACIRGVGNLQITNNYIYDCSLACNQATYNTGIMCNDCFCSVISGNIVRIDNLLSGATSGLTIANYSATFYNKSKSEYAQVTNNTTNLAALFNTGMGSDTQEGFVVDYINLDYPSKVDLDTAFVNGKPADDDYFTYTASGTGFTRDTSNKLTGTASMAVSGNTYVNIRPSLTPLFKKSLVTFRLMAKAAAAGDKCTIKTLQMNNAGSVLEGTDHTLAPSNSTWDAYEYQVRTSSNDNSTATRLRVTGGTGTVYIDEISLSYQPLP